MERFSNPQILAMIRFFPPSQRLFVQRWVELFAHASIEEFLCRPAWRECVQSELLAYRNASAARPFHIKLLEEEERVLRTASSISSDEVARLLDSDPTLAAELGATRGRSFGFHPQFLYSAYLSLLPGPGKPDSFEERLARLFEFWKSNSTPRSIQVAFPLRKGGALSTANIVGLAVRRWTDLAEAIRDRVETYEGAASSLEEWKKGNAQFVVVDVESIDHHSAAERALEQLDIQEAVEHLEPMGARARPLLVEDSFRLVHDSGQSPVQKAYTSRSGAERLRMFRVRSPMRTKEAIEMLRGSEVWSAFADAYCKGMANFSKGNFSDALAFFSCAFEAPFEPDKHHFETLKAANSFVEWSAILMALDWPRYNFNYLYEYLRMRYMGKQILSDEDSRTTALEIVSTPSLWNARLGSDLGWDELLKFRRDRFLGELAGLQRVLPDRRKTYRWDLARAVRARHELLHRGRREANAYLIRLFQRGLDVIFRAALLASQRREPFEAVLQRARQDFEAVATQGAPVEKTRSLVLYGWQ